MKTNKKVSLDYLRNLNNDEIVEILTTQKGIGIKTASCVLLFSLLRNVCPVDTHVHRVVNRLQIVNTKKSRGIIFMNLIRTYHKILHINFIQI